MNHRYPLVLLLLSSLILCSFRWPVENKIVTATFGESRYDHFHGGIDLAGGEQEIFPVTDGQVIYREEEHSRIDGLPAGLGSFAVIEHDRGLRTLYAHMKAASMTEVDTVGELDVIGIIGDTGGSYGKHLHLTVIDREFDQLVNPLLLLPPILDTSDPVIRGLYILRGSERFELTEQATITPGPAQILLETHDLCDTVAYFCPTAPYQIDIFMDGKEIVHQTFELLKVVPESGVIVLGGGVNFDELYAEDWIYQLGAIDFSEGDARIEVVVKDFAGNSVSKSYRVAITSN